jgi:integrase
MITSAVYVQFGTNRINPMKWKVANVQEDSGSYYIRLYEGSHRKKIKLGRLDEFPNRESLVAAAHEMSLRHQAVPSRTITLSQYIKWFYLPTAKAHVRTVTAKGYETLYKVHVKPRPEADRKLWEYTTVELQALLHAIAAAKSLTGMTMRHIKAFLSGVFRQAIQTGHYKGVNPVHEARLPWGVRESGDTKAYTLDEIHAVLERLPLPVRAAFAVAAFAGLRRSEIAGLEWSDIENDQLWVRRSVVAGIENRPKSKASRSWVPIIAPLAAILNEYRASLDDAQGRLFSSNLGYAARRYRFHFHAARRGLSSNLFGLGVSDLTCSRILRHQGVQVTRAHYIALRDATVDDAMEKLNAKWDELRTDENARTS